jgi:hypothetical protein
VPDIKLRPDFAAGISSPSQQAVARCGAIVRSLMGNESWRNLYFGLRDFRRAYTVLRHELKAQIEALKERETPVEEEILEDFFVQYATYGADEAYSEHDLMQSLMAHAMARLADVVDAHTQSDNQQRLEDITAAEAERKQLPVPLGFHRHIAPNGHLLGRDKPLTLLGYEPVLVWLIRKVLAAADAQVIIHLTTKKLAPADFGARLISVAREHWQEQARSFRSLAIMAGKHIYEKLGTVPDLLICDDLAAAAPPGLALRPPSARSGDSSHALWQWAHKQGMAQIGCLPLEDTEIPDLQTPAFEQLRSFTHLVPVYVAEHPLEPSQWRITVGFQADVFNVAKKEIEACRPQTVLVSGVT